MDGIMPMVEFFVPVILILLVCAGVGALVGYRDLPNRSSNMLAMLVTVWVGALASWLFFTPGGVGWLTHGAAIIISLTVCTGVFIAGAKTGERVRYPRKMDFGY